MNIKKGQYRVDYTCNEIKILDEANRQFDLEEGNALAGLDIVIAGEGNRVIIGMPNRFLMSTIKIIGNNNTVVIGASKNLLKFNLNMPANGGLGCDNREFSVGKNCYMGGVYINCGADNHKVIIGEDCFFSDGIVIRTVDGHTVYDSRTLQILNDVDGSVEIGNHVWCASGVRILKSVHIAPHVILATAAVITSDCKQSYVCVGGVPARVIKKHVNWSSYNTKAFKKMYDEGNLSFLHRTEEEKSMSHKKVIAIIPARYQSSRFPGKPLALILGKPMVQWVYERISMAKNIDEVYVATDDQRIYDTVKEFGGRAIMTGECECGSARVFQASEFLAADIILNVQGDEPMIKPEMVDELISAFDDPDVDMATLKKEISDDADIKNPNIAKVVTDINQNAILFSRSVIPYNRDNTDITYYKHIGIYGYKKEFLKKFVEMPQTRMEKAEQLEQLRVIENGYKIRVIETKYQSIGVDLPEHVQQVEKRLQGEINE